MSCIVHIVINLALTSRSLVMTPSSTEQAGVYRSVVLHPALDDFRLLVQEAVNHLRAFFYNGLQFVAEFVKAGKVDSHSGFLLPPYADFHMVRIGKRHGCVQLELLPFMGNGQDVVGQDLDVRIHTKPKIIAHVEGPGFLAALQLLAILAQFAGNILVYILKLIDISAVFIHCIHLPGYRDPVLVHIPCQQFPAPGPGRDHCGHLSFRYKFSRGRSAARSLSRVLPA
nr:MAG TPA: hypothetical protein [Caudoviricetes sp.]